LRYFGGCKKSFGLKKALNTGDAKLIQTMIEELIKT
jgi:hypothetical protein